VFPFERESLIFVCSLRLATGMKKNVEKKHVVKFEMELKGIKETQALKLVTEIHDIDEFNQLKEFHEVGDFDLKRGFKHCYLKQIYETPNGNDLRTNQGKAKH